MQEYSRLELLKPHEVSMPEPIGRPFESLGKPVKALICEEDECEFISLNRSVMAQHCNNKHKWISTRGQREVWHGIWVQTFFVAGKQKYFSVQWSKEQDDNGERAELGALEEVEYDIIQENWKNKQEKHEKDIEKIEEEAAKQDKTGWYNQTGWVEHLAKSNMKHLAHTSRLPDRDEKELQQAVKLVEAMIEICVAGLRSHNRETRRWLKSAKQAEPDVRPIGRLQNHDSQLRYAGYWKRFICYCLRVSRKAMRNREAQSIGSQMEMGNEDNLGISSDDWSDDSNSDTSYGDSDTSEDGETEEQSRDTLYDANRLFPWQDNQLELAGTLWRSIELGEDEKIQIKALLELSSTFIFQKLHNDPYKSGLVHFLAVLGIDEEMGRLRQANDYSYMLAGLVYDIRVIAAEVLLPSSEREEQSETEINNFLEQRKRYLADGSYGPMSWMLSLLAYGKHIALNHGNAGMIDWPPGEDVMTLNGKRIYMQKFKDMVLDTVTQAEHYLWEELMWCGRKERFEVPLEDIEDDVTFVKRGYSFTSNSANNLDKGLDWMLKQMLSNSKGRKLRQDTTWQLQKVKQYLKTAEKFRELLLFLVHITGGQPARGPEITSLRFKNGFLQDRNIFVMSGQMSTVTRYNKSQSQWDEAKVIPRFLPWKVGQLLVMYIAYIQPFMEMLLVEATGSGWTDYIWADNKGPWETDRMTKVISRETSRQLGIRLTTHTYRHAAAAIGRKKVSLQFAKGYQEEIGEIEEVEVEEDEDPNELAAGRGSAVGANRYGVASNIVKHLSLRSIETFRPLCEKWHEFLGLESYGRRNGKRARESGDRSVAKKMAVTTSEFQDGIGRLIDHLNSQQVAQLRAAPDDDWYFGDTTVRSPASGTPTQGTRNTGLGLEVGIQGRLDMATPQINSSPFIWPNAWSDSSPLAERQRWESRQDMGLATRKIKGLRRRITTEDELKRAIQKALQREEVSFRSKQQEEAMRAVIANETPLVVILPTGGGKSLLFLAPACLERDAGMTIVVVPYRQLTNEFMKRALGVGIECEEWKYDSTDPATLMVVSADQLINHRFLDFASRMRTKGILRRAFVDECHLAFIAHDWRPKLVYMKNVRHLQVPTIMLTATLPPSLEFEFEESMALQYARYIRASTVRVSTRYYVHECKRGELRTIAVESCKRRKAHFRQKEKGVVYCRSRDETERLAEELGCGFVHAGSIENEESISRWLEEGGFMVATSALGTGVDFPGIVFILHAGMPYGMIDYAQESGRAGRGGEEVRSVIIVEEGFIEQQERRGLVRSVDEATMVEYIKTEGCRRAVFSSYFDKEEVECADKGGMARCDRCGEGEGDMQHSERVLAEDREVIEDVLDGIANGCRSCWIADVLGRDKAEEGGVEWEHGWEGCERRKGEEAEVDRFRGRVRFDKETHSCHKCGFSQRICATGVSEREKCQWPGISMAVALAACRNVTGRGIIRRAGYKGDLDDDLEGYTRWLGWRHRARIWEELMSNAMAVVFEFLIWSESVR